MSGETTSANMGMPIPGVGNTSGPTWASDLVACLNLVDQHDHSNGNGVQITPAGLNINSDLSFGNNNATGLRSSRYQSQSAVLSGASDLNCAFVVAGDLYFNDGSGNHVRITQSGGVAGSPGTISNLTSPASAAFVSASSTFVWQSAANTPAYLDGASVLLRNLTANSKALTLAPPNAMGANYTVTLPTLPGAQSFLTIDSSGNMAATTAISNGITRTMLAAVGQQTSSSITTNTAGTTFVSFGSVVITTTGRPVIITLQPVSGSDGSISVRNIGALSETSAEIAISSNGGSTYFYKTLITGNQTTFMRIPCSSILAFDTPAAGTTTYTLYGLVVPSGGLLDMSTSKLVAYEL